MLHDINQIRNLRAFIKRSDKELTPYELFNSWTQNSMDCVQDIETVEYYMALIPMIKERERRLAKQ